MGSSEDDHEAPDTPEGLEGSGAGLPDPHCPDLPHAAFTRGLDDIDDEALAQGVRHVVDHLVQDAISQLDRPHVLVIQHDASVQFVGPFPTAMEAAVALEEERAARLDLGIPDTARLRIVALWAAICPHEDPHEGPV